MAKTSGGKRLNLRPSRDLTGALERHATTLGTNPTTLALVLVEASMGLRPFPPGYPVTTVPTPSSE
jgi:hypothetical protein